MCRKITGKIQLFSGYRMNKSQCSRMEQLPVQMEGTSLRPVYRISQDRMVKGSHVYSDLMGTAGLQPAFHQCKILLQCPDRLIMRHCSSATLKYCYLLSVFWISGKGKVHGSRPPDSPVAYGSVNPFYGMLGTLQSKASVGTVRFTYYKEPAGILVDPVHDARPLHTVNG